MVVGGTARLQASISPSDATVKTVTWSSSNSAVVTVSDQGDLSAKAVGTAAVTAAAGGKSASATITVVSPEISVERVSMDTDELYLYVGDSYTLTATVQPENATDKSLSWASANIAIATVKNGVVQGVSEGETTVTATSSNGKSASCRVVVSERFAAVDLGLSVKWASMNLGASDDTEGGSFYAWGELTPKSDYSWQTYKYASGSMDSINKYGAVTDTYVLADMDDAACSEKGSGWRIPTKHEFKELLDNCDFTWSEAPAGYRLTSKKNGNSLFFPAAGYMEGTDLQSGPFCVARYWTSSTGSYDGEAAYVGFYNSSYNMAPGLNSAERCWGYAIRAVYGSRRTVPEAKVKVDGTEFDFGEVKVGETGRIVVTVSNVGDAELTYNVDLPRIVHSTDNFSGNITIQGNSTGATERHTVAPGASDTFTILYKPVEAGKEEYSKFYIYSDAVNGNKCITVRGRSVGKGSSNEDLNYGEWDF